MNLVLASASPRRRELLDRLEVPFEVMPALVFEWAPSADEHPVEYALALARAKATAVANQNRDAIVLAADTVVVVDREILGKPDTAQDAADMLGRLSGRRHAVITAVALQRGKLVESDYVETAVTMRAYSKADIDRYVASGEPMDKAGAYAVQGEGRLLVERVEGCLEAVIGLPLCLTSRLLTGFGMSTAPPGDTHGLVYP